MGLKAGNALASATGLSFGTNKIKELEKELALISQGVSLRFAAEIGASEERDKIIAENLRKKQAIIDDENEITDQKEKERQAKLKSERQKLNADILKEIENLQKRKN